MRFIFCTSSIRFLLLFLFPHPPFFAPCHPEWFYLVPVRVAVFILDEPPVRLYIKPIPDGLLG